MQNERRKRRPVHPGRLIREFMGDSISVTELAEHIRMTRPNLSRVLNEHGGVSAELALRLSEAFHTSPELWMSMQANYDLGVARASHSAVKAFPVRQSSSNQRSEEPTRAGSTSEGNTNQQHLLRA